MHSLTCSIGATNLTLIQAQLWNIYYIPSPQRRVGCKKVADDFFPLRTMQVVSWVFLLVLFAGSWLFFSWQCAWSVAVGGITSIVSFHLTHQDVASFIRSLGGPTKGASGEAVVNEETGKKAGQKISLGKSRYVIKFWLRLAIIGLILLMLIKSGKVNIFGLLVGLSTVVFSITLTTVGVAGRSIINSRR